MDVFAPRDVLFTVTGSTKKNCVLEEIIPSRQMGIMWKGVARIWMSKTGYFTELPRLSSQLHTEANK
jgi:hypothetical protein